MKTFRLDGKVYEAKEIDFNMICDLEEQGISLEEIEKKPMSMMRTYIGFCINGTKEMAGKLIENHLVNGGSMSDIAEVMGEAMTESGFFQALNKTEETKTTTRKKTSKEKEKIVAITEQ